MFPELTAISVYALDCIVRPGARVGGIVANGEPMKPLCSGIDLRGTVEGDLRHRLRMRVGCVPAVRL